MSGAVHTARRRGAPLVMLALVLTAWTSLRAVWWENPFPAIGAALTVPIAMQEAEPEPVSPEPSAPERPPRQAAAAPERSANEPWLPAQYGRNSASAATAFPPGGQRARLAAAQNALWQTALRQPLFRNAGLNDFSLSARGGQGQPPFLPSSRQAPGNIAKPSRWSLDAWAFWRQGSDSAPVSQGRVPIYGASQVGALLQYHLAAKAARDPRLYIRGYRALVPGGESEVALGASLRPIARLPLRFAGEARYTDAALANELRPSAYVVTEIAPIRLPYGTRLEAYGQAGWVGGRSSTAFADGQASVTRDVPAVAQATGDGLHFSFGAAAWGGAQEDAQRLDVGPTLRLDLTVGEVPARISIDWRERVGGQAGPDSGVAATVSARF